MEPEGGLAHALTPIDRDECLELLATSDFGRVAVVASGQPLIFPVNFVLDGDLVVFRTAAGTKLEYAALDRVAFEVDSIDPETHEGWSVMVTGAGRELTDALDEASVREQSMSLTPWAAGAKDHWLRIIRPQFSGRRIGAPRP